MNTSKQINAMIALMLILLVGVGIYTAWDPFRAEAETERSAERLAEYAAHRYARNCRQCHGNEGEGRTGLGPALNPAARESVGLPSFVDPAKADENQKIVLNTIVCGRIGSYMPAWSAAQGGNLSDEQIRQLVLLITQPPKGAWEEVAHLTAEENATVPLLPIAEIQETSPITGAAGRVCGQRAPATPDPANDGPVEVKTSWPVVATDNRFNVTRIAVPPGQEVTLTLDNKGQALHNLKVQNVKSATGQDITTKLLPGGQSETIRFTITAPGSYPYLCEVHPVEMKGTLLVQAASPSGSTTAPAVTTTPAIGTSVPAPSPSPSPSP